MWIDLDQDGVFEGGSGTNGSSGNEILNPNGGTTPNVNEDWTSGNVALTAGQEYLLAIGHWEGGGGSRVRPWVQIPGGSFVVMNPLSPAQDGYFNIKGLSNGNFLHEQSLLEANGTNLVKGNTYYYRIKGVNSEGTDWADSTASFVSENALDTSTGTLTFNTDGPTPSWSASSGAGGTGTLVNRSYTDSSSNTISYNVAKFDFDRLNIGDGVAVSLTGANPLEINVAGDATILSVLDANGTQGDSTAGVRKSKLGGGFGGYKWDGNGWGAGTGPEHLTSADTFKSGGAQFKGWSDFSSSTLVAGAEPGGGSYAGVGGRPEPQGGQGEYQTINSSGGTYGDADITHLLAGSGGGGGNERQGGGGGGAIKIVATGTLTIGANVWADGGRGGARWNEARRSGGSGSGGAIYLKGDNVIINAGVKISASGGLPAKHSNGIISSGNSYASDGGSSGAACGGGGRVYLEATSSLVNNASTTNSNLSASGGTGTGRPGTDGTVKIIRPQVTSLVFNSGSMIIDTSMATITHSDGSFLAGSFEDRTYTHTDGTPFPYKVCIFTADQINLGSGVLVTLQGSNALSLRTRNNGDFTLSTQLIANGTDGGDHNSDTVGKLGAYDGGGKSRNGKGPGGGANRQQDNDGTSGSYAKDGVKPPHTNAQWSNENGDLHLTDLLGGSGGGGGQYRAGGSGGGAIELVAHGAGLLKLDTGSRISVNGGDTTDRNRGGGGGSGGSIRLVGGSIENNGDLQARGGGLEPGGIADYDGTGGRIAFDSNGTIKIGTYDLSGHSKSTANHGFAQKYPFLDGTLALRGNSGKNDLSYESGTLVIDTSAAYWHHSSGDHGSGVIQSHTDTNGDIDYKTCTFTFNSINLSGGVNVVLQGDNSLILKTQSNGNINIGVNLSADGTDQNYNNSRSPSTNHHWASIGKLGGRSGKTPGANDGVGPGKGQARVEGTTESDGFKRKGGGGGYGSAGEHAAGGFGETYGSATLAHLHGGSSGGAGQWMGSGAGGGAISLEAHGDGNVTIQSGITISANGSGNSQADTNDRNGGGGSGGSLRFAGNYIINNGTISAKGGTGNKLPSGGGGRVAFNFRSGVTRGVVDVGSGEYVGTISENSTPIIVNPGVVSITYDNLNYQAPATRANDLVLWYKFDETSGTTVKDSSGNGRDGTAVNAGASSWVPGVMGNGLKLDSGTMTSTNSGGQYVDMGTNWTIGGSMSVSTWLYMDIFANYARIMDIGNGADVDNILIAQYGTNSRFTFDVKDTLGGNEGHAQNESALLQQWFHLVVTVTNGDTNACRYKFYLNGSFLGQSGTDKSPPISKPRSNQWLGRSNWGNDAYMKGRFDDFRIYVGELTPLDVSAIYNETAAPVAGTIGALYGPTSFTATGLPSGLSIDSEGRIKGRTTAVGDHNVTIGASNLSGSASDEVITLRVAANKPVFASTENAFSPLDLSPGLWVDAADVTTITGSTSTVSQWRDKSGNNRHLNQTTASYRPTYKWNAQNGLSVVSFDGSNDYMDGTGLGTPGSISAFAVINRHSAVANGVLLASDGAWSGTKLHLATDSNGLNSKMALNGGGSIVGSNTKTLNAWSIDTFHRGDVTNWGSTGTIFHNGSTDATASLGANTLLSLSAFNIGNWHDGSSRQRHLDGDLAELIIYTANLSDHDRQRVEVYLARKWGLLSIMPSPVPSPSDASKNPYVSTIGGNSVTTSVPLVDDGGEDANVSIFYGTADLGAGIGGPWTPSALGAPMNLWLDASDASTIGGLGWTTQHLTGDADSKISTSEVYTCKINVKGSNKTINGVTFSGSNGTSGTGWKYSQGFSTEHNSQTSTVGGQMGAMLSNGFRYNGVPQVLTMRGLTVGKRYTLALYSQAWGSNRPCVFTCSSLPGSMTVNQDQYHASSQDGLLLECTYEAKTTDVDFEINPVSGHTWHLYAFSNREASSIPEWKDKSGKNYHFAQSTLANQPKTGVVKINNLNTIDFDGAGDRLTNNSYPMGGTNTIYAVGYSAGNGYKRLLNSFTDGYFFMGSGNGTPNMATFYGGGSWNDVAPMHQDPALQPQP